MKKVYMTPLLVFATAANAAGLKKVLILDFINISQNPNYIYLEESITSATRKKLQDKFAFKEMQKQQWQKVMKANHLFREDTHSKSTGMTMGLLAKQDVVICGGFVIKNKKKKKGVKQAKKPKKKKKAAAKSEVKKDVIIVTNIKIIDIAKKKVIAEFSEKGPADARIFDSVERIANRIAAEAKSVLPNKADWKGKEFDDEPLVILSNYTLGLRVGGGAYASGFSDRIEAKLPTFSALLRANLPIFWQRLALELNGTFWNHSPIKGKNPAIEDLTVTTSNYAVGGALALDFAFSKSVGFHPKVGGGYVLQTTTVTGTRNENMNLSFPYALAGLDFSFAMNKFMALVLGYEAMMELESGAETLYNYGNLGINLTF